MLTGLSLGVLTPARAADDPTPTDGGDTVTQVVDDATGPTADPLSVPVSHEEAQESLAEVQELFTPMTRREAREKIASGDGKDATMALRDLSLRMGSLSKAEMAAAVDEFGRPWKTRTAGALHKCDANICVHWFPVATGGHAASTAEYATSVLTTLVDVSRAYHQAGYRDPKPDGTYGGTGATDIYLDDVGATGKYGYCTIDVDRDGSATFAPPAGRADVPAFCVLDNDFSKKEFPTRHTSQEDLKVTAAHEYFHAVQFSYDFLEDRWFMEATATWAEDQLYDSIDDNLQYLRFSQIRHPGVSLDTFNGVGGGLHYGDWIFFRYLTERVRTAKEGLPTLMLRMWQYADSSHGPARDRYSVQAIVAALREKHLDFNRTFAQYAAANQHAATAYAEGRANHYPSGKVRKTVRLKPGKRTASASYKVNHLAYATTRFLPKHLRSKRTKLTLSVDMAKRKTGSVAVALVFAKSGRITTRMVRLGKAGNGKVRVPFSSRRIARVELVLVNANHAFRRCWVQTPYSCSGIPARNHVVEKLSARVR